MVMSILALALALARRASRLANPSTSGIAESEKTASSQPSENSQQKNKKSEAASAAKKQQQQKKEPKRNKAEGRAKWLTYNIDNDSSTAIAAAVNAEGQRQKQQQAAGRGGASSGNQIAEKTAETTKATFVHTCRC